MDGATTDAAQTERVGREVEDCPKKSETILDPSTLSCRVAQKVISSLEQRGLQRGKRYRRKFTGWAPADSPGHEPPERSGANGRGQPADRVVIGAIAGNGGAHDSPDQKLP